MVPSDSLPALFAVLEAAREGGEPGTTLKRTPGQRKKGKQIQGEMLHHWARSIELIGVTRIRFSSASGWLNAAALSERQS